MNLSVVIVNFRSAQFILDCLRSINKHKVISSVITEVIVVDNDSGDDSEQLIMSAFPMTVWIQMGYNSGFSRANNAGIKIAKGEIILLLNPDTLFENNVIEKCAGVFLNEQYIACGVQLLNEDKTPQVSGNYFIAGGLNQLIGVPYIGKLLRWIALKLKTKKTSITETKVNVEVDWINGAFLMVKKDAIKKAGLLDEDFFLYSEEIEWCSRLRKVGNMCIYGMFHVIHLQGSSTSEAFDSGGKGYFNFSDKKGLQIMLSNLVRIRKQYGVGWCLVHWLVYFFTIPVYMASVFLQIIFLKRNSINEWKSCRGYSINVLYLIPYLFRIVSGKPYFYKVL